MKIRMTNRTSRSKLRTSITPLSWTTATRLAVMVLMGFSLSPPVALAGKPLPPPPPPPPAVYYDVIEMGNGSANSMNEAGTIVGNNDGSACRFDLVSGTVDLNDLGATWIDLNVSTVQTVAGWIANRADGINNHGDIVGRATNGVDTRLYRFDLSENQFYLLPGPTSAIPADGSTSYFGASINDAGVICSAAGVGMFVYTPTEGGSYTARDLWPANGIAIPARQVAINNAGKIVGWYPSGTGSSTIWRAFRITPVGGDYTLEQFQNYRFRNISDNWICGERQAVYQGKQLTQAGGAIRLAVNGATSTAQLLTGSWAADVNAEGDACINNSAGGILSMGGGASLQINQLIAPEDKAFWDALPSKSFSAMTNRDAMTGFGCIGCYTADFSTTTPAYRCFLLKPRKP